MSKIRQDYANKNYKSDNYSTNSSHKVSWFIALLCLSLAWGQIAIHILRTI